jgi:probable rRNA maturation factor
MMMGKIKINMTFDGFTLRQATVRSVITRCIHAALKDQSVDVPCEINVLITNDKGIQAINKASRDMDKPTDVLSFPMFQLEPGVLPEDWEPYMDPETGMCPLGDMAISLERAVAQAKEFGHSVRREVGYLTIHSVLHLLGYDHLDEGPQKQQMRLCEERIAAGIPGMKRD